MSPKDVIMKMVRTDYRPEFVQYAFEGCWDAIRKKQEGCAVPLR